MMFYEFSVLLSYGLVVAAESEKAARAEFDTWDEAFTREGEFIEVTSVELVGEREAPEGEPLADVAHVYAEAADGE